MNTFKNIVSSIIDKTTEGVKTLYKGAQLTQGNTEIYADMDSSTKLRMFQNKFFQSKGVWESNWQLIDEREAIYNGTHAVDLNINEKSKNRTKKLSNNVRNICYELIESAVDNNIPMPTVKAKRPEGANLAKMIEDSIRNDMFDSKINKLNDRLERTTMKHGFSATEIVWNPDYKHHLFRGEIEYRPRHPKQIIPQANVYDIDLMDYIFVLTSVTKGYIKRKYGVDLRAEREQFPEVNYIPEEEDNINTQYEKVTEIVCWYKDEDGDVGKFSWVNNVVLEDLAKYYYRRMPDEKGALKVEEFETLVEDVTLRDGTIIPAGTQIPYFVPRQFPIIVRINVPSDFGFGGISDIDTIRDQQDVVKKLTNNIEEKILRGGSIITKLEGHKVQITNELNQVVSGNQTQINALNVKTLNADINKELEFLQVNYQAAKDTLGITNSWQGKDDAANQSGKAIQAKIAQSGGRIQSKLFNKYDFYKQLFEMSFWFKLAYYDELRPYVTQDAEGKDVYGDFNKYEFLVQDKAGEWYYNTDFIFTADAGSGIPKDKVWQMQTTIDLFQKGAFNPTPQALTLWQQLQEVQYPGAANITEQLTKQIDMQKQIQDLTSQLQSLSGPKDGENPFQQMTDNMSPEELDHIDQNPESVLQELQGGK